jgi:3',5'-cyclic AMP phosphodiesterase CpdA
LRVAVASLVPRLRRLNVSLHHVTSNPAIVHRLGAHPMHQSASWQDRRVRKELGAFQFSFAVIADTHVDVEDGPSSSPFPVNRLSNSRTRFCIEDIKQLGTELGAMAPAFVLHMGDVIHPVPSMPSYAAAARDFFDIVEGLPIPLHLIPGNHDVGDKSVDWAPAGVVQPKFLELWEQHFGAQYHAFDHGGMHFVLLNAQIINSGLESERHQRDWLAQQLAAHAGSRVVLCMHYPPYLTSPDETENYDNVGEPGRSWILELIERHRIEALFCGHVHHYWYNRYAQTDCYLLPSTSFTRQDYSEMFRAAPTDAMQDGRNDAAKVGYFIVNVHEHGHVCHLRRTDGALLDKGARLSARLPRVASYHPREMTGFSVGFDLRHPWAELTEIAPSGALDEFHRKKMRNDYPLLALWEMGVRHLRIPIQDLESGDVRQRVRALIHQGQRFSVLSQGIPNAAQRSCLISCQDLIDRWEVALPLRGIDAALPALQAIQAEVGFPIYLAKLRTKIDFVKQGEPYYHLITYGFTPEDADEIRALTAGPVTGRLFSGYVFRIGRHEMPVERFGEIVELVERLDTRGSATLFMAGGNPALHHCDDLANANRMAEAVFAGSQSPQVPMIIDTFMDHDRGHAVRNGVIDRHCNPRLGYHMIRTLHAILAGLNGPPGRTGAGDGPQGRWLAFRDSQSAHILLMPSAPVRAFSVPKEATGGASPHDACQTDLCSSAISDGSVTMQAHQGLLTIKFAAPIAVPTLVSWQR